MKMGYSFFTHDDAITNAGGTQIKYVNTKTTVDVSGYGNILGAIYTESSDSTTKVGLVLLKNNIKTAFYKFTSTTSNGCDVDFVAEKNIRVFYF